MNNATQITDAERALIGRWFDEGAPGEVRQGRPAGCRSAGSGHFEIEDADNAVNPQSTRWTKCCRRRALSALGLQHVLVMYAGAIAVPLIVGRALQLAPADVAFLISADLFACGLVTLIQSLGVTQYSASSCR